jgi:hypothetical protein
MALLLSDNFRLWGKSLSNRSNSFDVFYSGIHAVNLCNF